MYTLQLQFFPPFFFFFFTSSFWFQPLSLGWLVVQHHSGHGQQIPILVNVWSCCPLQPQQHHWGSAVNQPLWHSFLQSAHFRSGYPQTTPPHSFPKDLYFLCFVSKQALGKRVFATWSSLLWLSYECLRMEFNSPGRINFFLYFLWEEEFETEQSFTYAG